MIFFFFSDCQRRLNWHESIVLNYQSCRISLLFSLRYKDRVFKNIGERKKDVVDKVKVGKKSLCRHKGGRREKTRHHLGHFFFLFYPEIKEKRKTKKSIEKGGTRGMTFSRSSVGFNQAHPLFRSRL
jgi:hypothetical protein